MIIKHTHDITQSNPDLIHDGYLADCPFMQLDESGNPIGLDIQMPPLTVQE